MCPPVRLARLVWWLTWASIHEMMEMKARRLNSVDETGDERPSIDRYFDQFYGEDEAVFAAVQDPVDLERRRKQRVVGRASTPEEMQAWRDQMAKEKQAILSKG